MGKVVNRGAVLGGWTVGEVDARDKWGNELRGNEEWRNETPRFLV